MNSNDIPGDYLEMTANAVRIVRAADDAARAQDVLDRMARMHPEASPDDLRRSVGYAARLLTDEDT